MSDHAPRPTFGTLARVLFDESHSESWSASREKASGMTREHPSNSSYQKAMDALRERGFEVERIEGAVKNDQNATLVPEKLKMFDLLILAHPCSQDFEKTTSDGKPP